MATETLNRLHHHGHVPTIRGDGVGLREGRRPGCSGRHRHRQSPGIMLAQGHVTVLLPDVGSTARRQAA